MMMAGENNSGQKLTMVFTNLYRYYLANSYLPSFLLVVICYSTFYFRLEDFNERIMVSITAMLVLVALFQQTSSTILKTTYLKLIDVWYMVCIVVDFVMVILLVVIDFIRHYEENTVKVFPASGGGKPQYPDDNKSRKYNTLARVVLLVMFLVFLAVYVTVSAVEYITG